MEEILLKALQSSKTGQNYAFATIVESTIKGTPRKIGSKMIVCEGGHIFGSIGGGKIEQKAKKEALKAIKTKKPVLIQYDLFGKEGESICGGRIKVFIDPCLAKKHLVICGAGHIALPLSVLAKLTDFKVTIIDNRKELANKTRFPHADKILLGPHVQGLKKTSINQDTYVMIVTHDHRYDYQCLSAAIRSQADYIGVIASKAKREKFLARLKKQGIPLSSLRNVSMPAGLDIGAQTPQEIALSIAAQLVAKANKRFVGTEKFKQLFSASKTKGGI